MKRNPSLRFMLIVLLASLVVRPAAANGGQVRVSEEPAGPYLVTVFTSPSPFRAGPVDVSVYVADAQDLVPVQDAVVTVTTEPLGHSTPGGTYPATREQATVKEFYAAKFALPSDGRWRVTVDVSGTRGAGSTTFEVEAGAASVINGPLLIVLLALVPLGIAWRLAQAQRRRLSPAERAARQEQSQ